jgi:hypothetical protein
MYNPENDNIVNTRHKMKTKKTAQYVMDIIIRKQTSMM